MPIFLTTIFARLLTSRFYWILGFVSTVLPMFSMFIFNTAAKVFGALGGGWITYQLGDELFNLIFSKIKSVFSGHVLEPLFHPAVDMISVLGIDTALNVMASFYFALLTIKGMDRFGQVRKAAWSSPRKLGEGGSLNNNDWNLTGRWGA